MDGITLSYTAQHGANTVYSIALKTFGDSSVMRARQQTTSTSSSANGTTVLAGSSYAQKSLWNVVAIDTKANVLTIDEMYAAWDKDRADGLAAAVGVNDTTFGAAVVTSAVFPNSPQFTKLGENLYEASFVLTEV